MLHISRNTLNGVELISATWTGHYKDDKKEYIIFCRYPSEPGKFVVSTAYENEGGWVQGHYFHSEYDENAFHQAKTLYNNMVKKYMLTTRFS